MELKYIRKKFHEWLKLERPVISYVKISMCMFASKPAELRTSHT